MAVTSIFTAGSQYSGEETTVGSGYSVSVTNADAPGDGPYLVNLASGANTITLVTGKTIYGVSIIPPSGNTTTMTLKGVSGDGGIALNLTRASHIALASSVTTFVITTGGTMAIRLAFW